MGKDGQQLAELHALKKAIETQRRLGFKDACVIGDNLASLYTGVKMSAKVCQRARAKVLRQLAYMYIEKGWCSSFVAYIPTFLHVADEASKPPCQNLNGMAVAI